MSRTIVKLFGFYETNRNYLDLFRLIVKLFTSVNTQNLLKEYTELFLEEYILDVSPEKFEEFTSVPWFKFKKSLGTLGKSKGLDVRDEDYQHFIDLSRFPFFYNIFKKLKEMNCDPLILSDLSVWKIVDGKLKILHPGMKQLYLDHQK